MRTLYVIAHNIRSTHNVGALLRTADGLGIEHVYLTGYTPYPRQKLDKRLPHISDKLTTQIHKTALGAEETQPWSHADDAVKVIDELRSRHVPVYALEQTKQAVPLHAFVPPDTCAILLGEEVKGVEDSLLSIVPDHLFIPMYGMKESFNVSQAAAMTLFYLRFS